VGGCLDDLFACLLAVLPACRPHPAAGLQAWPVHVHVPLPHAGIERRFRSKLDDYRGSGYDRGHMAPASNHKTTQDTMDETFTLSNTSPQACAVWSLDVRCAVTCGVVFGLMCCNVECMATLLDWGPGSLPLLLLGRAKPEAARPAMLACPPRPWPLLPAPPLPSPACLTASVARHTAHCCR
jgi:hypothetical protein